MREAEDYPMLGTSHFSDVRVQECLNDVIGMLNSCLDTHTEPTVAQLEEVRTAYHQAEDVVLPAREILAAGTPSESESEFDSEDSGPEIHSLVLRLPFRSYVPPPDSDDSGASVGEPERFVSPLEILQALQADEEWDDEE